MKKNLFKFYWNKYSRFQLTMRLIIAIQLFSIISVFGNPALSQQEKLSVKFAHSNMVDVLNTLKVKTNYDFLYNHEEIRKINDITLEVKDVSIKCILNKCLFDTDMGYKIIDNIIVITPDKKLKKRTIKGVVYDSKEEPLPGATIKIKGTSLGVATDLEGKFSIELPKKEKIILIVSFIGMENKEIEIKKQQDLKITLKEKEQEIEEVVVTGYANINKKSFTGSSVNISKEQLLQVSPQNIVQALQLFDPSLRITENTEMGSNPNALPEFYIRGRSGIGTTELDNISQTNLKSNPNLPTFIMDGYEVKMEKVYDLDPNRIESLTILKDAAATAIYGSRAANGVIVITTKAPKAGKLNVSYTLNTNVTIPDISDYDLFDAKGKLELEKVSGYYTGDAYYKQVNKNIEYYGKLANINRGVETDWLSQPLKTAINHKHSIYLEGGTKAVRYGIDLKLDNESGVMKESFRNKKALGFNLSYQYKNLMFRNYMSWETMDSQESPYGGFQKYTKLNPYDEFKDENGQIVKNLRSWNINGLHGNPLYDASLDSYNKSYYKEFTNNFSVQWFISNSLRLKGQFTTTNKFSGDDIFTDPEKSIYTDFASQGRTLEKGEKRINNNESKSWDINALLIYNNSLGKHNINITTGINAKEDEHIYSGYTLQGFPSGKMNDINYAAKIFNKPYGESSKTRLLGALFTSNYTYNNIYLMDISYRIDGGSQFGSKKKYAPFGSMGVGLNLHNYNFLKSNFLNQFKVRCSYGQTGKTNFPAHAAQTMYSYYTDAWYATGNGVKLKAMGNESLKWEKTNSIEFGTDIKLFNERLSLTANYYNKRTEDLITAITIASSTGYKSFMSNMGEVENKGYELMLRYNLVKSKNTQLSLYGSLSHNENKILKISNSLKTYNDLVDEAQEKEENNVPLLRYREGSSMTSIYAMKSLGINPANGKEVFIKRDGTPTYEWDSKEQVICGDKEPEASGSFGLNFYHKGFTVFAGFMFEFGGQRYNYTLVEKVENADILFNCDKRVLSDRWIKPGDKTPLKDIKDREMTSRISSRFIQDYNVLSLNSLSMGYNVDSKISKKIGLSKLRLQLNMKDLFRLSSVKQERGTIYPFSRSFNLTINANF